MMAKKLFKLYKFDFPALLILFFLIKECFANPLTPTFELTSSEVADGSILVIDLNFPDEKLKENLDIQGQFETIAFPFFKDDKIEKGVSQNRYQAVLGVPHNHKSGEFSIEVTIQDPNTHEKNKLKIPLKVIDGKYPSEKLKVSSKHVNPNKKDLNRIIAEQAEVKKIYAEVIRQKFWKGPFQLPIESPVTSIYGTKRVFNGKLLSFHTGLDLKAPEGTPIYSASPGKVVLARDLFFSGNTVIINHGYGVFTLYCHMSKIDVVPGQMVESHSLLGLSGKTGRATGPHLHWQAVVHSAKVNPMDLTKVMH